MWRRLQLPVIMKDYVIKCDTGGVKYDTKWDCNSENENTLRQALNRVRITFIVGDKCEPKHALQFDLRKVNEKVTKRCINLNCKLTIEFQGLASYSPASKLVTTFDFIHHLTSFSDVRFQALLRLHKITLCLYLTL